MNVDNENEIITFQMDGSDSAIAVERAKLSDQLAYAGRWFSYCLVSKVALDLMGGNRGKFGAQAAHGYQITEWDSAERFPLYSNHYRKSLSAAKSTLVVKDENELREFEAIYKNICGVALIKDAAHTVFKEPVVTVLGIGPIRKDKYGDMREERLQKLKALV